MTKFIVGASLAILIGLSMFFYFRSGKQPENIIQDTAIPLILEEPRQQDVFNSFSGDWISIGINLGSHADISRGTGDSIILNWSNLPQNTSYINIFRKSSNSDSWIKWKTIQISAGEANSLQVSGGYNYAIQAVSEEGNVLWSSRANTVVVGGNPPPVSSGAPLPIPTQSNPAPESTTNPPPIISQPPVSPTAPPEGNIYNPQGQVVGYQPKQTANFWVHYVNKEIELGWQNLPYNTNKLIIDRSYNSTNWVQLFEQRNPRIDADFIRLIDETFTQSNYYKFNAYNNEQLVGVYGPIYLAPYGN